MFNDNEIDEVFLEFRRSTRRLDGLSTPIIRDMIRSIQRPPTRSGVAIGEHGLKMDLKMRRQKTPTVESLVVGDHGTTTLF